VKVDATIVSDHLNMVAMGGRMTEVVLGPNFAAEVADEAEEVMMRAKLKGVKFPDKFGVMHVSEFARVLGSFGDKLDVELKDGKLVMKEGGVTVLYQTADVDTIPTTIDSFTKADKHVAKGMVVETTPDEGFLDTFTKYQRLIGPDLIEVAVKGKKMVLRLISMKGHRVEMPVGKAVMAKKNAKFDGLKVSAAAFADVLSGVRAEESDQLTLSVGQVLRVSFRSYTFLVSPQVEIEG